MRKNSFYTRFPVLTTTKLIFFGFKDENRMAAAVKRLTCKLLPFGSGLCENPWNVLRLRFSFE